MLITKISYNYCDITGFFPPKAKAVGSGEAGEALASPVLCLILILPRCPFLKYFTMAEGN